LEKQRNTNNMKVKLLYLSAALASLFTAAVFSSCKEDGDRETDDDSTSAFDGRLAGTIKTENGAALNGEIDQLGIYFDSEDAPRTFAVKVDGTFDLTLPAVTDADLMLLSERMSKGITVTPDDVKYLPIDAISAFKNGKPAGTVLKSKLTAASVVELRYIYADKAATITGTITEESGNNTFNMKLKAGWNTITVEEEFSEGTRTTTTGNIPADLQWTYYKSNASN
jgi:hypothetical protein